MRGVKSVVVIIYNRDCHLDRDCNFGSNKLGSHYVEECFIASDEPVRLVIDYGPHNERAELNMDTGHKR